MKSQVEFQKLQKRIILLIPVLLFFCLSISVAQPPWPKAPNKLRAPGISLKISLNGQVIVPSVTTNMNGEFKFKLPEGTDAMRGANVSFEITNYSRDKYEPRSTSIRMGLLGNEGADLFCILWFIPDIPKSGNDGQSNTGFNLNKLKTNLSLFIPRIAAIGLKIDSKSKLISPPTQNKGSFAVSGKSSA
jgi:hypothetical protein